MVLNNGWIRRRWLDFRYGHGVYLIFILSFSNFVLIFHRLLVERVDFLNNLFSELWLFILVFVLMYIPIAILVGAWHRKNQIKVDADVILLQSPLLLRTLNMIIDIQTGKAKKEDIKILQDILKSAKTSEEEKQQIDNDNAHDAKTT